MNDRYVPSLLQAMQQGCDPRERWFGGEESGDDHQCSEAEEQRQGYEAVTTHTPHMCVADLEIEI